MKIILIKQVVKLGNPGDVIDVNPGYARNFILAKGLGREATAQALAAAQAAKARNQRERAVRQERKHKLHNILEGETILIRSTANAEGHLFGGIDRQAIAGAIAKRKKMEIDPKQLDLPHHLKTLGKHSVVLNLGGGEKVNFFVDVQN